MGHLPLPGDPVNIKLEGLDVALGLSLLVMYICPFVWTALTSILIMLPRKRLTKASTIIGLIGIALDIAILLSPQFKWIVDFD